MICHSIYGFWPISFWMIMLGTHWKSTLCAWSKIPGKSFALSCRTAQNNSTVASCIIFVVLGRSISWVCLRCTYVVWHIRCIWENELTDRGWQYKVRTKQGTNHSKSNRYLGWVRLGFKPLEQVYAIPWMACCWQPNTEWEISAVGSELQRTYAGTVLLCTVGFHVRLGI